jgi:hypothetical protein
VSSLVRSRRKLPPAGIVSPSVMEGVSSAAFRVQPVRSMALLVSLYSSIHSSLAEVVVPIQATSLTITLRDCRGARDAAKATGRTTANSARISTAATQNLFVSIVPSQSIAVR